MSRGGVSPRRVCLGIAALCAMVACDEFGGGPRTVSKSGYRAVLAFSPTERYEVAVRGEKQRVAGAFDGSELVKVVRPDLGMIWQIRPATRKLIESRWAPTEELVPGYPLEPHFDPAAYADRFGGKMRRIDDAAHGMHPCERFEMTMPSGDRAILWVARDLERLVVRIEHLKRDPRDEYQPVTDTQLLNVRLGAPAKLFEKPGGFTAVGSYEELGK
ncbi:MAG TPA: hypothetical protein VMR54_06680 [Thermoanaerobaculia bacterium]|nr:hypothetical protein [Thermoanaerobaculia bacterium]